MKIKSQKDFFAGLMFMVVGIAFAWGATNYTIGEGARMGPGYFPLMLGILLALIGVFVAVRGAGGGDRGRREDRQVGLEAAVLHHRAPTWSSASAGRPARASASRRWA